MKSAGKEVEDQKGRAAGPEGEAKGHLIFPLGSWDTKMLNLPDTDVENF